MQTHVTDAHGTSLVVAVLLMCVVLPSCNGTIDTWSEPVQREIYAAAVSHVRDELRLAGRIQVHPYMAMLARGSGGQVGDTFNDIDTTVIASTLLEFLPDLKTCAWSASGQCVLSDADATIVLSEIEDLGSGNVGLIVQVMRAGADRFSRSAFAIRLSRGFRGGWKVVQFKRTA